MAFKAMAMIHSLREQREVTILSEKNCNHVLAEYDGQRCTAVFNGFNCLYYVDDKYGVIPESMTAEELRKAGY
jgi:hypothetical protein